MVEEGRERIQLESGDTALIEQFNARLIGVQPLKFTRRVYGWFSAFLVPICALAEDAFDRPSCPLRLPQPYACCVGPVKLRSLQIDRTEGCIAQICPA